MRYIKVTIAILLFASGHCIAQPTKPIPVEIKDESRTPAAVWSSVKGQRSELTGRKHHDAEVYRKDDMYKLIYFQMENDTMNYHSATYQSKDLMDKAEYYWDRDTISLHLYNRATKKEAKFRAYGYGSSSSMMKDTQQ